MNRPAFPRLLALPLALVACESPRSGPEVPAPEALRQALEPVYVDGAAAWRDEADTDCLVVLRDVGRTPQGGGYASACTPGGACLYTWRGSVDVDAARLADGDRVEVMYRTLETQGAFYAVSTTPADAAATGMRRYDFVLDHFTPSAGMSITSLNRTEIDLIPYVVRADGTRVFDHNRVAQPLDNYALRASNAWALSADDTCRPDQPAAVPEYALTYPDFDESLSDGPVVAGGALRVTYDARRLRETQSCLGSQGPASSTTVVAEWRFDQGPVQSAPVETYVQSSGYACPGQTPPCARVDTPELLLDVPADATSVALWFHCVPGFSQGAPANWKYDSDFGANYVLPVVDAAAHVQWAGGWALYNARAGRELALPDPLLWHGFTNMGMAIEARAYAPGVTDVAAPIEGALTAFVESDLHECTPGGALTRQPLTPAAVHAGPYGADHLYRWGIESTLSRCPPGEYRYRFLFSLDAGRTVSPLGAVEDTTDALTATTWRTITSSAPGP
jgi:hypothetical protein